MWFFNKKKISKEEKNQEVEVQSNKICDNTNEVTNEKDIIINLNRKQNFKRALAITVVVTIISLTAAFLLNKKSNEVGNTTGNIINKGIVSSKNGWTYYSDYQQNRCLLYRTNGNKITQLLSEKNSLIIYLNVVGDWVYYDKVDIYKQDGYIDTILKDTICKMKIDGSEKTELQTSNSIYYLSVVGDWIYYSKSTYGGQYDEYKIRTDGSEEGKV